MRLWFILWYMCCRISYTIITLITIHDLANCNTCRFRVALIFVACADRTCRHGYSGSVDPLLKSNCPTARTLEEHRHIKKSTRGMGLWSESARGSSPLWLAGMVAARAACLICSAQHLCPPPRYHPLHANQARPGRDQKIAGSKSQHTTRKDRV